MPDYSCPLSDQNTKLVSLAHGAGGKAMHDFIKTAIEPLYGTGFAPDHDGAVFEVAGRLAFTTDSYVVKPIFFPGGDIGKLAVYGTVNDLAMCGAKPLYLSCSFILEEGLPITTLQRVCASIASAVKETNVKIVTGDTKVVGHGQADGIYINTSGVGIVRPGVEIHPRHVRPGDLLILSGDLGRHGMAVMSARENLSFDSDLLSDCAPLSASIQSILSAGLRPKCLRDLTRGGLAATLHEISATAKVGIEIEEAKVPIHNTVRGACEILGFDPIYIANEGRFLAVVAREESAEMLSFMRSMQLTSSAVVIGAVNSRCDVELINAYGSRRILPELQGELLPRIC
jgi:hydrogenase expression/formation protein HypE